MAKVKSNKKVYWIISIIAVVLIVALVYFFVNLPPSKEEKADFNDKGFIVTSSELQYAEGCYNSTAINNANRSEEYRYCQVYEPALIQLRVLSQVEGIKICSVNETNHKCEIENALQNSCDVLSRINYLISGVRPYNKGRTIYQCGDGYYISETKDSIRPYRDIFKVELTVEQIAQLKS